MVLAVLVTTSSALACKGSSQAWTLGSTVCARHILLDMSHCNFSALPAHISASLHSSAGSFDVLNTNGVNSVLRPTLDSFELEVSYKPWNCEDNPPHVSEGWIVEWTAFDSAASNPSLCIGSIPYTQFAAYGNYCSVYMGIPFQACNLTSLDGVSSSFTVWGDYQSKAMGVDGIYYASASTSQLIVSYEPWVCTNALSISTAPQYLQKWVVTFAIQLNSDVVGAAGTSCSGRASASAWQPAMSVADDCGAPQFVSVDLPSACLGKKVVGASSDFITSTSQGAGQYITAGSDTWAISSTNSSQVLFFASVAPWACQTTPAQNQFDIQYTISVETETSASYEYNAMPDWANRGQWTTVVPDSKSSTAAVGPVLGMQSVHNALLPSGKVLTISGSSWRNRAPQKAYPVYNITDSPDDSAHGLYGMPAVDSFNMSSVNDYYSLVNNVGVYDYLLNSWFRLPHPMVQDPSNDDLFLPTDLFCTGHMHLPDGNIMFVGGTQFYIPYRSGTKTSFVFDWKKELQTDWKTYDWTSFTEDQFLTNKSNGTWRFVGTTNRGRWYPSLLPLLDGRMIVLSGFVDYLPALSNDDADQMYSFEINSDIEFFDISMLSDNSTDLQEAWRVVNVMDKQNSPFSTELDPAKWTKAAYCRPGQNERGCHSYRYDAFKLYPQTYLLDDGRIYFTREGDWNSLRTADAGAMRWSNFTYFMTVNGTKTEPDVSFSHGPDRPDYVTSSGTTVRDPTFPDKIHLFGGLRNGGGTMLPSLLSPNSTEARDLDAKKCNQFAGSRGSRKLESYTLPSSSADPGFWALEDEEFLGVDETWDRTMHYATLLPTKQILILNGGNYDLFGPVKSPILLTPTWDATGTFHYKKETMEPSQQPRLYHNAAVLLPTGSVLSLGGNAARATIFPSKRQATGQGSTQPRPNLDRVDRSTHFFSDKTMAVGFSDSPAENWVAEMFRPPYIFIDGDRRVQVVDIVNTATGSDQGILHDVDGRHYWELAESTNFTATLTELPSSCPSGSASTLVWMKLGSVTHGWDHGQRLLDIPYDNVGSGRISFTAPSIQGDNVPPAFYMLFFVDCLGKPSIAEMIQFVSA